MGEVMGVFSPNPPHPKKIPYIFSNLTFKNDTNILPL